MMDGMVAAIHAGLDEAGFAQVPLMSYVEWAGLEAAGEKLIDGLATIAAAERAFAGL